MCHMLDLTVLQGIFSDLEKFLHLVPNFRLGIVTVLDMVYLELSVACVDGGCQKDPKQVWRQLWRHVAAASLKNLLCWTFILNYYHPLWSPLLYVFIVMYCIWVSMHGAACRNNFSLWHVRILFVNFWAKQHFWHLIFVDSNNSYILLPLQQLLNFDSLVLCPLVPRPLWENFLCIFSISVLAFRGSSALSIWQRCYNRGGKRN